MPRGGVSDLILDGPFHLHFIDRDLGCFPDRHRLRHLHRQNTLLALVVLRHCRPVVRRNHTAVHLESVTLTTLASSDLACATRIADVFDEAVLVKGVLVLFVVGEAAGAEGGGASLEGRAEKRAQGCDGGGEDADV